MTDATAMDAPRVTALLGSVLDRARNQHSFGASDTQQPGGDDIQHAATISLGALLDSLEERAFGLGILILALPCAIPFLYGIPQIVALPMLALAAQLALGRAHPWLPLALSRRRIEIEGLAKVVGRAERTIGFLERLSVPRWTALSDGIGARIVGALMLIPAASILVPLPLTNTTPGIGIGIAAMGLLERDGLLIVAGLLLGLLWVAVLLFFGAEAVSAFKDLVLGALRG
ncbi:MAG: exopolysaccharide biosynthesis protein [Pseudomonadota bacterium]